MHCEGGRLEFQIGITAEILGKESSNEHSSINFDLIASVVSE